MARDVEPRASIGRRGRAPIASLSVLIGLSVAPADANAQGNYRSAPIGGRTTLLGGTGVVYGTDGASVFLNPAVALRTDPGRLAFSVNFYSLSYMSAPRWYKPGPVDARTFGAWDGGDAGVTDTRLSSLPSSLCLFFRVARVPWLGTSSLASDPRVRDARLGICAATTQTDTFDFDTEPYVRTTPAGFMTRQTQAIEQTFRRFQFGPTYAMWIAPGLTVGASIQGSIASQSSSISALTRSEGGALSRPIQSMLQSSSDGTAWQLHAMAGATFSFGRQSIGLAIEAPALHLAGTGAAIYYAQSDAGAGAATTTTGSGSFDVRTPARVSLGTGFSRSWGTVELDVSWFAPMDRAYEARLDGVRTTTAGSGTTAVQEELHLSQRARGVVNAGIGAEAYLSPWLSLLGGLSTDLSAVPRGELTKTPFNYYTERTHRLAASFGVGSHRTDGSLIMGAELSYGWGDRLAIDSYQAPPALEATHHETFGLLFAIAGSTSLRTISRAVEDVTKAITRPGKDGEPPPAAPPR